MSALVCGTGIAGALGASVPIGEFYYKTDDSVKVNYAKFQDVEVLQEGKKALKVDF